jgi:hypothetical protein
MSNSLAIATVTATLIHTVLGSAALAAGVGATVTTTRPENTGGNTAARINLYLFQITPNAAWRNRDLPTRMANSQLMQRPRAAIDLHYLITFYGNESHEHLETQRLLGNVVRAMHEKPVLTREMIRDTLGVGTYSYLAGSNLEQEVELVKFTPLAFSMEELSKLWSVFFQTPYALSIAYQGSVVLIESEETASPALPVRKPLIYTIPFRQPVIERVYSSEGATQPITATSDLIIEGKQLKSELTQVRVAGGNPLSPSNTSDTQLTLSLASVPSGSLHAGVQGLQVVQPLPMGEPPVPHIGFESNVAPFVIRPKIDPAITASATQIDLNTDVVIGKEQRVVLLLNKISSPEPKSYSFFVEPDDSTHLIIEIHDVEHGEYLVRLQVDGAESVIDVDPASPNFGPKVNIP